MSANLLAKRYEQPELISVSASDLSGKHHVDRAKYRIEKPYAVGGSNASMRLALSVKPISDLGSETLHVWLRYRDSAGEYKCPDYIPAVACPSGKWTRLSGDIAVPSGTTVDQIGIGVHKACTFDVLDFELWDGTDATKAVASHTPYATDDHLQAVYATKGYVDAELGNTKTDLANTKTDLANTKTELTATKTTADDAYSRTLRIELVSVPADDQGDTSRLTACVYRGGELLTNQDVAKLGTLTWYEDGTKKATGWTHTCGAGTAVECRLVKNLIAGSDFSCYNGTTYANGVWSIPANNTPIIKDSIVGVTLPSTDFVSSNRTLHVNLRVRAASGASVEIVPKIIYWNHKGNSDYNSAKLSAKGTGTWQHVDASLILPSGFRLGSFTVSQGRGAAVEITSLSLSCDSTTSLAVASHTPYATQGHLEAVYATQAQLASYVPGKIFVGTVVSTVDSSSTASGHEAMLFTKEEFTANFGRAFNASKDYVGVMNADGTAFNGYVESTGYFSSENIWVGVPGGTDGNTIRLNYLVVLGD